MKDQKLAAQSSFFPVWLLRSKVSPTRQRVDLLERRSHTLKLHQSLDATLSLIHAPAGYGKSTLLSNWRRLLLDEGHAVCWLSLEKQDNDPLQLLTYLAFSLTTGGVPFDTRQSGLEYQLSDLSKRDFLSLIIHFIAEQDRKVVLILDDFENLQADAVTRVIYPLLDHAPDNLHVSIATRDDSALKISSLEAKGRAVRFGAGRLKFTPMELSDFLSDEYDNQTIAQMFRLTEGWPVAIQMIRSAISVESDVERIMSDLGGDATQIAAYLSEEVISSLDPELQDFLMDISLVDRVECGFADYLRQQLNSQASFNKARSLDALVLPVDSVEFTYRLHPLFREHLYEKLTLTRPDRVKALHLRAADWFSQKGDLVEAVRQCVMAGEPGAAVAIVERAGGVLIWFQEGLTRLRAIEQLLDEKTILSDARMAMIRCLMHIKDGQVNQARQLFDEMVSRSEAPVVDLQQPGASSAIHECAIMEIVISIYEGKPISEATCLQLEKKIAELDEIDSAVKANLLTFLCVGNLQLGLFREARSFGAQAIRHFSSAASIYGKAYIHFHLGDISFAEGDSVAAAACYKKGQDLARKHFNDDQGMKLVANILIAELNYEVNDSRSISSAARILPRQLEKNEAWFDIFAAGYTTSAHREFDDYGLDAALAIVDRANAHAQLNKLYRLMKLLTCLRIDLLLRANRVREARQVLASSGIAIDDYTYSSGQQIAWRERDAAVQAITRLLIREGDHRQALSWLNYFSKHARTEGHVRARVRYKMLLAIAHGRNGDFAQRDLHLDAALGLSAKSRFVRAFIDESDELAQMFADYLGNTERDRRAGANVAWAQEVLKQFGDQDEEEQAGPLLSRRESDVLRELGRGFSNKTIARKIDVSESTVRFHLRNIFAKLNVRSRLQAVTVARQQNLL